jgi:hypothetical protein
MGYASSNSGRAPQRRPWSPIIAVSAKLIGRRSEEVCAENNAHVSVGKEDYYVSSDGYLMPVRKGQPPPDLRYFKRSGN